MEDPMRKKRENNLKAVVSNTESKIEKREKRSSESKGEEREKECRKMWAR